ncbi:formate dehydrogenase subunit beta [Kordiimonas sediminis]|uniref:Formate dehydrogenase subunit beta n=1 Tax=Kordiimonas sediminis TaxID=1735581 RepID=A0A919E7L8_9PROT|nr:formate dehydrogenase beta subunit [Kordiimonas sediminis]GHF20526.1 formate dehydrogenase subunit beta [Kordiimonas sediminis]
MTTRLYIPLDTSAVACGADDVAANLNQAGLDIEIIRTGSRGMAWLEPLIEVETDHGRIGYGPVDIADIESLITADFLKGGDHPLSIGVVDHFPWLKQQSRSMFAQCGTTDPLSLADYQAHGGFKALHIAQSMDASDIVEQVRLSGLRGRGGAAFPAGIKWNTVATTHSTRKFIVCNADEGDSGTFADRMILEGCPFTLIEGMMIAGLATGAREGYIYLRSEYPIARDILTCAIEIAEKAGILDDRFKLRVFMGAGAFICGEETSLLESLEGKRGQVRAKPPIPAIEGLYGHPTLVHNVLTLCAVPEIITEGGETYAQKGEGKSTGTMPFQLSGNIKHGGLIEVPFGSTLRTLIEGYGGGTLSGRPVKAVQIGGPLGAYLDERYFDLPLTYEAMAEIGAGIGHGGIVVFDDTADMVSLAKYAFEFCAIESCGKCTPCRIGSVRGKELMEQVQNGEKIESVIELVTDLLEVMEDGSLCAMGGMTPIPVKSALQHFPDDFRKPGQTANPSSKQEFPEGSMT